MKYPTRPVNITAVLPSAKVPGKPWIVMWWEVDEEGRLTNQSKRRFSDDRLARRFRRKLEKIRKSNLEARYEQEMQPA